MEAAEKHIHSRSQLQMYVQAFPPFAFCSLQVCSLLDGAVHIHGGSSPLSLLLHLPIISENPTDIPEV
jgi:hypothetical protein